MRLCTVSTENISPFFGVELRDKILRVESAARAFELKAEEVAMFRDAMVYFENLPKSEKALRALLQQITEEPKRLAKPGIDRLPHLIDAKKATWHPPIPKPNKFFCIGLNYKDHCEEQDKPIPEFPLVFNKFNTSLVGHGSEVQLPKHDKRIDYEAEFAVVIGKQARRVTPKTAGRCIGGYTIANDLSARTIQNKERQWARAKGWDGSGPFGPCIVTPDEVPDPGNLSIKCLVNGKQMQKSNTKNLVFDVPYLISFISKAITLEPGDVISTGTPGGVGVFRDPQVFLKDGDVVEVVIERLGSLKVTMVAKKKK